MKMNWKEQIRKVYAHLQREGIVGKIPITFNMPSNYSYYSPESNMINIGVEDLEKETSPYPALQILLHEIAHHLHHSWQPEDFAEKSKIRPQWEEFVQLFPAEEQIAIYRNIPLEKEANMALKLLWKQIKADWKLIFGEEYKEEN